MGIQGRHPQFYINKSTRTSLHNSQNHSLLPPPQNNDNNNNNDKVITQGAPRFTWNQAQVFGLPDLREQRSQDLPQPAVQAFSARPTLSCAVAPWSPQCYTPWPGLAIVHAPTGIPGRSFPAAPLPTFALDRVAERSACWPANTQASRLMLPERMTEKK
jgi:hypothetical protein